MKKSHPLQKIAAKKQKNASTFVNFSVFLPRTTQMKPMNAKSMKKLAILFVFIGLGVMPLVAQKLGGGLILGPTFSTMKMSLNDTTTFRPDFCAGVRIALIPKRFVVGAEMDVIYSRQGMSTFRGTNADGNRIRNVVQSHYINVPLLLNVYFRRWTEDDEDESRIPCLRVGPQVGLCLGGSDVQILKSTTTNRYITPWERGTFNRLDYGLTAAFSYWFVEVRYTFGLANVFPGEGTAYNHVISVTWSDVW